MAYYVYIIKSQKDGTYYKGFSEDYLSRLAAHNRGESTYTKDRIPWELLLVEEYSDKKTALVREKKLKKCKMEYFEWLKQQPSNILNKK